MKGSCRRALGLLLSATAIAPGASAATPQANSLKALDVLERTKKVTATYALYFWNRVTLPGQKPTEEWSAEFHSGNLHRVETPRERIIADCRAGTGIAISLVTGGVVEGPQVAGAACGINMNVTITAVESLGPVKSRFGTAERIRVVDREHVRDYDVADDGALLRSAYSENRPGGKLLVTAQAVGREATLPEQAMFDRASLDRSFVPEIYRQAPAR